MIKQVKRGWKADFWLGTHRIRKTFPIKKLAQDFESIKKADYLKGKFIPSSERDRTPFSKFIDEYFTLHASVNMVNAKNEFYRLKSFNKFFGDTAVSEITPKEIQKWKADLASRVKPSTFNRSLTALKGAFNTAIEWGKIKENPAQKITKLREDDPKTRYLTENEIDQLLKCASPKLCDFLVFAMNTGLRKTNVIQLNWEDIDFHNNIIKVIKTKSGKSVDIPINKVVSELLDRLRPSSNHPTGRVFDTTNLRREWERARRLAGIPPVRLHDMRHTFCSHLAMKGIDLLTISKLTGHADMKMTMRYAHLSPNHKLIAVNMLSLNQKGSLDTDRKNVGVGQETRTLFGHPTSEIIRNQHTAHPK